MSSNAGKDSAIESAKFFHIGNIDPISEKKREKYWKKPEFIKPEKAYCETGIIAPKENNAKIPPKAKRVLAARFFSRLIQRMIFSAKFSGGTIWVILLKSVEDLFFIGLITIMRPIMVQDGDYTIFNFTIYNFQSILKFFK